jgi:hypothetical protein
MSDALIETAQRRLKAKGACRFDVQHNTQFDWMQSHCLMWTGGQLRMMGARTVAAQVRILPVGDARLIIWDYEHLAQVEYLQFLLQFDNDDDLSTLAHFALYNFAALVLLARGNDYVVHSGQLVRGAQRAVPSKAEIEARHRRQKPYDNEPITVAAYLLFFHEEAHYIFRDPSAARDRYFQRASGRVEELRKKAERSLAEEDFRSVRGPRGRPVFSGDEAEGFYPRNLVEFLAKHQNSPLFVEEVACDVFAIEQLLKSYRTESTPVAIARLYSAVMMLYQIQATREGLRRIYERIGSAEDTGDADRNTENQIRNDVRGFYFTEIISEIVNPEPSFWPVYEGEVTRLYKVGLRERYWRLVVKSAAVAVIAKAHDKAWLAECEQRTTNLNLKQLDAIREALGADFGLNA